MEVKARIPGTVVSIQAQQGDAVKTRSILCVVEAMKMEQPIPCPKDGVVTAVGIAVGDHVKTGQVLFEIE